MSDFSENIKRLLEQSPALALELRFLGPLSGHKSGGFPLPLPDAADLVVLGTAHFAALPWLEEKSERRVFFVEPSRDRLRALLNSQEGSDLLKTRRAYLLDSLPREVNRNVALVVADHYQGTELSREMERQFLLAQAGSCRFQVERSERRSLIMSNILSNFRLLPTAQLATDLWGNFTEIPAIICGAGPSLDAQLGALRQAKEGALLMAGGSALTALIRAGLPPHFGAGIDPSLTHCERYQPNHLPFFYRNRIHVGILPQHLGPKLYVSGAASYPINNWIDEELGIPDSGVSEGPSVTTFLLSIADKLGCSPLYLVGADLCFQRKRRYSSFIGQAADQLSIFEREGKETTAQWLVEAEWISRFARRRQIFNASVDGLPIQGVPAVALPCSMRCDFDAEITARLPAKGAPSRNVNELLEKISKSQERCRTLKKIINHDKGVEALIAQVELEDEIAYRYHACYD